MRAPLGPKEVAGHTLATVISAGTELAWNYTGKDFPSRPGYAAVFRVEQVGTEVTDLKPGDLVFCMGRHQSYQRMARPNVVPVPKGLSAEAAVFARMMGISMSTLTTTTARPPGKVLVTGLGLVGHLAAQIFAGCGYEVIACDPVPARRQIAEQMGLRTMPSVPVDDPDHRGQVDLVVECSGHEQAVLDACKVVRKRGEVVMVGVPWKRMVGHAGPRPAARDLPQVRRPPQRLGVGSAPPGDRLRHGQPLRPVRRGPALAVRRSVKVDGLYEKVRPSRLPAGIPGAAARQPAEKLAIVFDLDLRPGSRAHIRRRPAPYNGVLATAM